jgi:aldehyde dehydrogenase (NAD(P)+)
MNPVNEYLGPYVERAFKGFIEAGYFAIVYGGPEVGSFLAHHAGVDGVHVTGSEKTHDAIVWGPSGPEREDRKRRNDPVLKKPISSELGNISPVIFVPGPYTDDELSNAAENIAGMITHNASFNCNAAKLLVVPKGWAGRDRLVDKIAAVLSRVPTRKAYYPGAFERYETLTRGRTNVRRLGEGTEQALPWTLVLGLDSSDTGEKNFANEPFCCMLSEVAVGSDDPIEFTRAAVDFVNDRVWGTLVASFFVHPTLEADSRGREAIEDGIRDLRYGTVAVNTWPALGYALCATPWGGHPSSTLANIQSGTGWVNNTVMLEGIEKCVVRAPLLAKPKPIHFPTHKTLDVMGRRLVAFESTASWLRMPALGIAAFGG